MQKWLKDPSPQRVMLMAVGIAVIVFAVILLITYQVWWAWSPQRVIQWDLWNMLEGIGAAAAFAAVVGGGVMALQQLTEATDARQRELYNVMFERLMSDAEIDARRWIYLDLPDDPAEGLAGISKAGRAHVKRVLNSFDYFGFLIKQGWGLNDAIVEWVSPIVVKTWVKVAPYVAYERGRRNEPEYYADAEYLYEQCLPAWVDQHGDKGVTWVEGAL